MLVREKCRFPGSPRTLTNYAATTPAPITGMPLAIVYRYGGQWNEWFVRGDAAVSASPTLTRGARLAAWDGDNPDNLSRVAVATAVYLIPLPAEAQSLTIDVGYQPQDTARDKRVAGFLFVRNRDVERQYAAADSGKTGPFDEPGFYGDTYLLPAGQVRASFDIPAADRLSDGGRDDRFHGHLGLHAGSATAAAVSASRADWLKRNFHVAADAPANVTDMARPATTWFQSHSGAVKTPGTGMRPAGTFRVSGSNPMSAPTTSSVARSPTKWTIEPRSSAAASRAR